MLVDSHCHLDFDNLAEDLGDILTRARTASVGSMVTICTRLSRFEQVRAIAEANEGVTCSVGVHPHEADGEGVDDPDRLVALAAHPVVVGIGETGLDYYYEHSKRAAQQTSFRAHIAAARQTGLPLIVHTRDAEADTIEILEEEYSQGPFPGVIHCFSAGKEFANRALALDFYLSFSGIVTFKRAEELRAIALRVPTDRILVATDAPYLAPIPHRGKRTEPAYVAHTANQLAELRGVTPEEFASSTTDNFFRLFAKAPRPV